MTTILLFLQYCFTEIATSNYRRRSDDDDLKTQIVSNYYLYFIII